MKKIHFIVNVSHERISITKIQHLDKVDILVTINMDSNLLKKNLWNLSGLNLERTYE